MTQPIGPVRRIASVATSPAGVGLTAWSYIWRITPVHRRELEGSREEDMPPPIPPGVSRDDLQQPDDGSGPLFHRTYTGVIRNARLGPPELIERLAADPNRVAPLALARFHKTKGERRAMRVGDEFLIHMPAPWDGPVRAVDVTPTSFRFATLKGHLEAGQIEWRAFERDDRIVFQVDSRARSGDRFSALLHDKLPMAKEVQLHMWTSVIEHVARESGGRLTGGVDVETRRVAPEAFPS
jgi:hypothetical protein